MRIFKVLAPFFVTSVFVGLLATAWFHRFYIYDSVRLQSFDVSEQMEEIAVQSGMSDEAQRLFYAARPQLLSGTEFELACTFEELSLVLGCYSAGDIYILDVTEERLESVETVTAAHEMLHVVYARLSDGEISELKTLLDTESQNLDNQRILEVLEEYKNDPNSDLYNEMHSIFATEENELSPELESHYARYFTDRSKVLEYSAQYEEVFLEIDAKVTEFDERLAELDAEISTMLEGLNDLALSIEQEGNEIDRLKDLQNFTLSNALIPDYNASIRVYQSRADSYEEAVDAYNKIVRERNKVQVEGRELIKSLDSSL